MINTRSIQACDAARFGRFKKPLYDSYNFSKIPNTVRALLGCPHDAPLPEDTFRKGSYDFVLLFLIDSFGWHYFQRFSDKYPFLKRFLDEGIVSKLTSQFPSTTTNHMTCMHTGLSVGQSGLYEWFCYDPTLDEVICPFHFSYAKDKQCNTLSQAGVNPNELFPFQTTYQRLEEEGIRSVSFQEKSISRSPYSKAMYQGAEAIGYNSLSEGLAKLLRQIRGQKQKSYYLFYYGKIDGTGHDHGPYSQQVEKEIDKCLCHLEKFWQELATHTKNGCIIVTADHGMAPIIPEKTYYINQNLPHFNHFIKKNKNGTLLVPCGSSRDMFLHIKEEHLKEAHAELQEALVGIADVHTRDELIQNGLFGPVSDRFLARAGNLVALPYEEQSVWWYEEGRYSNTYHGHHGGLTPLELETIFLFLNQ